MYALRRTREQVLLIHDTAELKNTKDTVFMKEVVASLTVRCIIKQTRVVVVGVGEFLDDKKNIHPLVRADSRLSSFRVLEVTFSTNLSSTSVIGQATKRFFHRRLTSLRWEQNFRSEKSLKNFVGLWLLVKKLVAQPT